MNKILKDRTRLIKAMFSAKDSFDYKTMDIYNAIVEIISKIKTDPFGHYVSLCGNTAQKISYAKDPINKLDISKRTKTTLGRYIRRILKVSFEILNDYALDTYCNEVSKYLVDINELDSHIEILSDWKIINHYRSSTSKSCMTGTNAHKIGLYALNPDKVSLVVYERNVRVLLWTCDDGTKVLDRIYPAHCAGVVLLTEWAKKKKFVRRSNPDKLGVCDRKSTEKLSDNSIRTITLKYDDTFPYMDTFKYLSQPEDDIVIASNARSDEDKFPYVALHTTGALPWNNYVCDACGNEVDPDDLYYIDDSTLCSDCYNENYTDCIYCNVVHHNDEMYYVDGFGYVCVSCRDERYIQCHHCEKYIPNDDSYHIDGENYCACCFKEFFTCCDLCGEFFANDEIEIVDKKHLCSDCVAEIEEENEGAE